MLSSTDPNHCEICKLKEPVVRSVYNDDQEWDYQGVFMCEDCYKHYCRFLKRDWLYKEEKVIFTKLDVKEDWSYPDDSIANSIVIIVLKQHPSFVVTGYYDYEEKVWKNNVTHEVIPDDNILYWGEIDSLDHYIFDRKE
jgi:hypothetical protein